MRKKQHSILSLFKENGARKALVLAVALLLYSCGGSVRFADRGASGSTSNKTKSLATKKAVKLAPKIEAKKAPAPEYQQSEIADKLDDEIRERIIAHARGWLGVPYRWGGDSKSGVDCSGLVVQVFGEESYMLPRTAASQFAYLPIVDDFSDLSIGDLVFFSYDGTHINHVGICSGYGQMIHASSSRGVVEDSFLSGFFGGKFAGGGLIG